MGRRKGTRYLSILRGKRTAAAKTQLLNYLAGTLDVSYPERQGDRPTPESVWVDPFGIPLATGAKLLQFANSQRLAAVLPFATGFVTSTAPAESLRVVLKGVLSPRAAITTARAATGVEKTSKLTGLRYKDYGGNSITLPFGQGTGADEKSEDAVFRKIYADVKEANERNTCTFVPGSYSV